LHLGSDVVGQRDLDDHRRTAAGVYYRLGQADPTVSAETGQPRVACCALVRTLAEADTCAAVAVSCWRGG
jgi:hypothetical protein